MFCPSCGKEVGEGDAFCGSCGRSMKVAVAAPAESEHDRVVREEKLRVKVRNGEKAKQQLGCCLGLVLVFVLIAILISMSGS